MKKVSVFLSLALVVLAGCQTGGTIEPNSVVKTASQVQALAAQLTAYKAVIVQLSQELQTAGLYDANTAAKIAKANAEFDKVIAQANSVTTAIQNGTYSANDQTFITLLKAAQAANIATTPFNPYAGIIGLILTAVITILGLYAKKQTNAVNLATTTLGAVTLAIERVGTDANTAVIKDEVASNLAAANITNEGKALISATKAA